MSWTYSLTDLGTNNKDQVRFLIGDTIPTDPQVADEEINWAITQRSTVWGAAAECCRNLASKNARKADSVQGEMHTLYSSISKRYGIMAADFEGKAAMGGSAIPYAGGLSYADKQQQEEDADRVKPQFNLGMDDNFLPVAPAGNETLGGAGTGASA